MSLENSRVLYPLIKNTDPLKPSVSEAVKEPEASSIHSQASFRAWEKHFRVQFNLSTATVNLLASRDEPLQVDTNPPSEMKFTRETCFLK